MICDACRAKIEKEKREHAKQHGMIRTEFSGGEIAEEMEKERQMFQLQMCEVSLFSTAGGHMTRFHLKHQPKLRGGRIKPS